MPEFLKVGGDVSGRAANKALGISKILNSADPDVNLPKKSLANRRAKGRVSQPPKKLKSAVAEPVLPATPVVSAEPSDALLAASEQAPVPSEKDIEDVIVAREVTPPSAIPVNATELQKGKAQPTQEELAEVQDKERKTEERTRLIQDAQTLEELCDIVASFDTVPSIKSGDTPGGELAKWMRDLLLDSNRFIFDTYEEFEKEWKKAKKTVTKAYGIQEKFDALLREKMRLEFAEPLPPVMTPEEEIAKKGEKKQPTREELAEVKDFDALFVLLDKCDGIQDFDCFLSSEELKHRVELVRYRGARVPVSAETANFWETVEKLMKEEQMATLEKEKKIASEKWTAFMESVKDGESIVLANGADRTEWINIKRVGDSWFFDNADVKQAKNDRSVDVRNKVEAGWVVDSEHSSPDDVLKKWGTSEAEMKERAKIESEIKLLEGELDVLRRKYAQKDYEETGVWQRLSRVFNKKLESKETTDEKMKYQAKLRELRSKRLDAVMKSGKEGNVLKHAMAEEIQYFKIQANNELYAAWTDAEAERKGLSEKILDFGRKYNKLPLWKKIAIGGAVLGVAGAAAGGLLGAYGIASATVFAGVKRGVAAGGLFATLEAWHEKKSRESFGETKENRTKNLAQVEKMMEESQSLEDRMAKLKEFIDRDFESIDQNLASRVGNRDRRRVADFSGAIAASFGLVAAWDYLHGAESVSTGEASGAAKGAASATTVAAESEAPAPEKGREWMLKPKQLQGAPQASVDAQAGVAPAPPSAVAEAVKPSVEVPILADTALAEHTKLIDTFVNQDIKVAKGDSVWKISGRMADQMKLTGGARTHFIATLKDKFGDIQLQEGETINFGAKGIDREFIEKALGKSGALTAEQIHSIEANDAKIAEFARANPDITLTNESVDQILHSNPSGGVSLTDINGSREQYMPSGGASSGMDSVATAPAEVAPSPSVKDIISQAPEKLSSSQQARLNDWYMQIFRTENSTGGKDWVFDKKSILKTKLTDIVRVSDGKMIFAPGFDAQQVKNFKEFSDALPKEFSKGQVTLAEFVKAKPDITVNEYLARVAQNVKPGTRIGLYTTTN